MSRKESERDFVPPERVILEGRQYALVPPGGEAVRAVHVNRAHRPNLEATAREGVADRDSRSGRGEPSGAAVPSRASSPAPSCSKVTDEMIERATEAIVKVHDDELRAYLAGEVPANQWRPERYAVAAVRAALEVTDVAVMESPPIRCLTHGPYWTEFCCQCAESAPVSRPATEVFHG